MWASGHLRNKQGGGGISAIVELGISAKKMGGHLSNFLWCKSLSVTTAQKNNAGNEVTKWTKSGLRGGGASEQFSLKNDAIFDIRLGAMSYSCFLYGLKLLP